MKTPKANSWGEEKKSLFQNCKVTFSAIFFSLVQHPVLFFFSLPTPGGLLRPYLLTSQWSHALLNSLSEVLFNSPSQYLATIGLVQVFSLRWSLLPTLGCIPEQSDSRETWSDVPGLPASHQPWAGPPSEGATSCFQLFPYFLIPLYCEYT